MLVLIHPDGRVAAIIRHDEQSPILHDLARAARNAHGFPVDS